MPERVILIVDDNDAIRGVLKTMLEAPGYEVVEAADGMEALDLVHQRSGAVDAVVSDVMMPGMNGFQLAEAMRVEFPSLPVVFISGYCSEDEVSSRMYLGSRMAFVPKPFTPEQLINAVQSVLGGSAKSAARG